MGKLTDTKLRALKPNGKVQKYADGDGLYAYLVSSCKNKGHHFYMKNNAKSKDHARKITHEIFAIRH